MSLTHGWWKSLATALVCAALSLAAAGNALAQGYPAAPIRVLTGFPPGTAADVSMRTIAPQMSALLGQQVIVENRAGAGSRSDEVIKALREQSVTALGSTPAELKRYVETENVRWTAVINAAGLKKE
jgi:tripartite-type tricarboxylate transporter receptor subunit TctC